MTIEFHSSPTSSLGVEVELSLVDRETHGLTAAATDTLADVEPDDGSEHPALKHELFESTVETITGICDTVSDARRDLEAGISELRQAADARGVGLLCSGTHPFSSYRDLQVSPSARYQKLLDEALLNPEVAAALLKAENPANRAALARAAKGWQVYEAAGLTELLSQLGDEPAPEDDDPVISAVMKGAK